MDRYWRALDQVRRSTELPEMVFSSLLTGPPANTRAAGRWSRAVARYLTYPLLAALAQPVDQFHLLDHSHSHLLAYLKGKAKKVVTVHDLAPLRESENLSLSQVRRFEKGLRELRRADLILAVSSFTAKEIERFLDAGAPPIEQLPMGVASKEFATIQSDRFPEIEKIARRPVVLCVGSNLRRKNLRILPDVLRLALDHLENLTLLRVGPPLEEMIRSRLSPLAPKLDVVELSDLPEKKLVAAYQRSDLLFFPSTLEGFGLPVLEAMASGTPVVASNAASIPEVGGNAVLYFDPTDVEEAARLLLRVLGDADLRAELRKRGHEQAAKLDWKNHFTRLCEHYRQLAFGP
jgi:glycosyltransferase involved in cell wall biosynthesis